jgi:predicted RNA-binding protein Jag
VSDVQAPESTPAPAGGADIRPRVERLLTDILAMMGFPARLDFKDASDGSLSVALHFQGEPPPGVEPGKRSQVVDSLQFLLNKMLHRPGNERRFLLVGVGVHPEPRSERLKREQATAQATAAAQAAAPAPQPVPQAPAPAPRQPKPKPARGAQPAPSQAKAPAPQARGASESDERSVEVAEDAALREVARKLAEKSAALGRFYALVTLKQDDRARVLKAVEGVPGVKVSCEGEGRNRRVVFTPEKTAPLPKRSMLPDDDDEDDLEG